MPKYACKVDANQPALVRLWRSLGCSVAHTHANPVPGFPDVLLAVREGGPAHMVEIKDGEKDPSARKLTKDEEEFWSSWKGEIHKIETEDEAIELVNRLRRAGL